MQPRPFIGHGVGLRVQHYARALEAPLDVDWLEALTENFFGEGGRPLAVLRRIRQDRPIVFHGVSLGVGNLKPAGAGYLAKVRALIDEFEPPWVSDHLCWGALESHFAHDLLPLPHTEEAMALAVDNVRRARDVLGCEILLENVSSYVEYRASSMPEWEFLAEVSEARCRTHLLKEAPAGLNRRRRRVASPGPSRSRPAAPPPTMPPRCWRRSGAGSSVCRGKRRIIRIWCGRGRER
jgi:uncharacterized protein (UPF0276 family)